jgi:predicted ferric reductase
LVKALTARSAGIWEIVLTPKPTGLNFAPGQFAFIRFLNSTLPTEPHPFSIISSAGSYDLTFGIKESGDYTRRIGQLEIGTEALVEGPYGRFALKGDYKNKDLIWIAGGIGVTPFVSMANSLPEYTNKKIDLYYSVVKSEEAVFLPELSAVAENQPSLKVIIHSTAEKGFLTAQQINQTSQNLFNREIYLCGPVGMMRSLRQQLVALGVSNKQIHSEEFALS